MPCKLNAAKAALRLARANRAFRKLNAYRLGMTSVNAGHDLVAGKEWETSDGYRVKQTTAVPDPNEPGHFYGTLKVIDFADSKKDLT